MISSDLVRASLELVILSVVAEGPSYGYAIAKQIEASSDGVYPLKETTLYAAIRRLEQRGDLLASPGLESAGRPRTYYELTDAGRALLAERQTEWRSFVTTVTNITRSKGTES